MPRGIPKSKEKVEDTNDTSKEKVEVKACSPGVAALKAAQNKE